MRQRIIFTILLSFILSGLMTLWVTWLNLGWHDAFVHSWLHAFRSAWPAAALIAFFTAPSMQRLSIRIDGALTRRAPAKA